MAKNDENFQNYAHIESFEWTNTLQENDISYFPQKSAEFCEFNQKKSKNSVFWPILFCDKILRYVNLNRQLL